MEEMSYFTNELREIFKKSYKTVEQFRLKEVPLDLIISNIIKYYLEEGGESEALSNYLESKFEFDNSKSQIISSMEFCINDNYLYNEDYINKLPNKYHLSHDLAIASKKLKDLLGYLINKKDNLPGYTFGNNFKIDTVLFLGSALGESTKITELLRDEADITSEDLAEYLKKFFSSKVSELINSGSSGSGNIFEKRLDFSDEKSNRPTPEEDDKEFEMAGQSNVNQSSNVDPNSTTPFLDTYSVNLTKQCKLGNFDPVVGRDKEISQVIEILSCRKKSNCVLLGDPGVGKTSIVVGLVQAIESGNVPIELKGKEVRSLDIAGMVSGSTFRGDFEKKLLECLKELVENPNIIAFIDEMHQIMGAGSNTPGNGDAGQLMKPYLSGTAGKITVIGATTAEEYRKFVEKDGALKRRFQEVSVEEPGIEETVDILTKIAPKYEEYHKVIYSPEVIRSCVEWSGRYIDRYFPDKAIDCLDIAGSLTKLNRGVNTKKLDKLENNLKLLSEKKKNFILESEFKKASKVREKIIELESKIEEEKSKLNLSNSDRSNWINVSLDTVAEVISKMSKVPVDKIRKTSFDKLRSMKNTMEQKIIGQPDAIRSVSMTLNRQFLGFKDKNKPVSLMFIGKTATGKTYLSKILANEIFGSDKNLIRIDCSLLASGGEASGTSLLGSSAGYVGYDSPTIFEEVRKRPFSVVLFDEIEKAPEGIINTILLPLLDEGYVTLANNTRVNFSNCIVIFTSNIGTKEVEAKGKGLGFSKLDGELKNKDDESTIMKAIKKKFRPEVINRISEIIFFRSLNEEDLKKIFDLEIAKLKDRLSEKGFTLSVTDSMKNFIVSKCDLNYGARDLQRHIVEYCENSILESMLNFENIDNCGKNITVDLIDNNPVVNFNTTIVLDKSAVKQLS